MFNYCVLSTFFKQSSNNVPLNGVEAVAVLVIWF